MCDPKFNVLLRPTTKVCVLKLCMQKNTDRPEVGLRITQITQLFAVTSSSREEIKYLFRLWETQNHCVRLQCVTAAPCSSLFECHNVKEEGESVSSCCGWEEGLVLCELGCCFTFLTLESGWTGGDGNQALRSLASPRGPYTAVHTAKTHRN